MNGREYELVARLFRSFHRREHDDQIRAYLAELGGLGFDDLATAVRRLVRNEERMPSLAKLRGAALRAKYERRDKERGVPWVPERAKPWTEEEQLEARQWVELLKVGWRWCYVEQRWCGPEDPDPVSIDHTRVDAPECHRGVIARKHGEVFGSGEPPPLRVVQNDFVGVL